MVPFLSFFAFLGSIFSIGGVAALTLTNPGTFASTNFDYVIVGGGTAGLVVASRLSENHNIKVGVIEAGEPRINDPLVDTPRFAGSNLGNPTYDWNFVTVPQANVANRVMPQARGKMLGGSSALNFLVFHRGSKEEYDTWETLGAGRGWNWRDLLPFFKKSEDVLPSTPGQYPGIPFSTSSNNSVHGRHGPVEVRYSTFHTDLDQLCLRAFERLGLRANANPFGGDATGSYDSPRSADIQTGNRSYSASAYYYPFQNRPNLLVLTGALATKINFASAGHNIRATNVSFTKGGQTYTARASKEVILSAGTFQTPQLLELSGIGNPTVLNGLGINTLVSNTAVGNNLQDHLALLTFFVLRQNTSSLVTLAELDTNATFAAEQRRLYVEEGKGAYTYTTPLLTFSPLGNLVTRQQQLAITNQLEDFLDDNEDSMSEFERHQAKISLDLLKKDRVGQTEFIPVPGILANASAPENSDVLLAFYSFGSRLFSHGSVHISSIDPSTPPNIDPRYFSNPFDKQIVILTIKTLLKIASQPPLSGYIREPVGLTFNATDAEIETFVLQNVATEFHPIGTASLGRRGRGGVVDEKLIVYGTVNLRVVDASVIPAHIAAHIQATVYAIAEKAASMIREHWH